MTATTTADRRRIIELKLWMEDHDITVKATSESLGWAFATTRYNLMVASEPKRREKLLAMLIDIHRQAPSIWLRYPDA